MNTKPIIIANEKCWIEHTAKNQLEQVAELPHVLEAVGLPDLHAGKIPIGVALATEKWIYPHLIGNDIGCGMGLFQTQISMRKYKQDKFVTKLNYIRELGDIPSVNPYEEESPIFDLGTLGGGNHFAELQTVEKVYEPTLFEASNIPKNEILFLVHTGSRGYGQQIYAQYGDTTGLDSESEEGKAYLNEHNRALLWAKRNRLGVAKKLIDTLGFADKIQTLLDCPHNFVAEEKGRFIHRKGATSALQPLVLIPGSRGTLTYIVAPTEKVEQSLDSLSHGAGRKWARSLCKSRINKKYDRDTIRQTNLKSRVVCHDTNLLFQEAPEAYKNIEQVIRSLLEYELITVVATLRPLITFKG